MNSQWMRARFQGRELRSYHRRFCAHSRAWRATSLIRSGGDLRLALALGALAGPSLAAPGRRREDLRQEAPGMRGRLGRDLLGGPDRDRQPPLLAALGAHVY